MVLCTYHTPSQNIFLTPEEPLAVTLLAPGKHGLCRFARPGHFMEPYNTWPLISASLPYVCFPGSPML